MWQRGAPRINDPRPRSAPPHSRAGDFAEAVHGEGGGDGRAALLGRLDDVIVAHKVEVVELARVQLVVVGAHHVPRAVADADGDDGDGQRRRVGNGLFGVALGVGLAVAEDEADGELGGLGLFHELHGLADGRAKGHRARQLRLDNFLGVRAEHGVEALVAAGRRLFVEKGEDLLVRRVQVAEAEARDEAVGVKRRQRLGDDRNDLLVRVRLARLGHVVQRPAAEALLAVFNVALRAVDKQRQLRRLEPLVAQHGHHRGQRRARGRRVGAPRRALPRMGLATLPRRITSQFRSLQTFGLDCSHD